jgi:hypothetical protein
MRFVAGNKTPREAGMKNLKKMAKQQADYGESRMASPSNKTRHVKNTKQEILASQRKSQTNSALAGATGGLHGSCMKHDRQASSGLSLANPEVEWSGMKG